VDRAFGWYLDQAHPDFVEGEPSARGLARSGPTATLGRRSASPR
jgi:hypothetical protein